MAAAEAETARYYEMLSQKYRAAASRPWRSVPPDPPAPKMVPDSFFKIQGM